MFSDQDHPDRSPHRSRTMTIRLGAAAAVIGIVAAASPSAVSARPIDGQGRDVVVARDHLVPIELECSGTDDHVAAIGCRWSVVEEAAGVRLVRVALGTDGGRVTVARFDDPSINHFVDSPVRRGVRYLYVVRAYNGAGELIGTSRPSVAGVPAPADVEALRLDCSATSPTTVRCASTPPKSPARIVTLWRSIDGGARERVSSSGHPFPESYGDVVPAGTSRVAYAVIATDGAGVIVGRSRAEYVRMPRPPVDPVRDTDAAVVDVQPADERPAVAQPDSSVDESPADTSGGRPATSGPTSDQPNSTSDEPRDSVRDLPRDSVRDERGDSASDGPRDSVRPADTAPQRRDATDQGASDSAAERDRVEERTR